MTYKMAVKDLAINAIVANIPLVTFAAAAAFLHWLGADQPISIALLGIGTCGTIWMLWEWSKWTYKQSKWREELEQENEAAK